MNSHQFVLSLACLCAALYVVFFLCRRGLRRGEGGYDDDAEYFESPAAAAESSASPVPEAAEPAEEDVEGGGDNEEEAVGIPLDLQKAIDFSDITVSETQRAEYQEMKDNAKQIQSVEERFAAAKRKTEEHGLKPGVLPNKKRRELVEALVRRPFCGRRTRSWRTEFSDNLRGDVVPKNTNNSWSMMRIGRTDPSKDLHPGALGTMSGLSGQWVSEKIVPENVFEDVIDDMY